MKKTWMDKRLRDFTLEDAVEANKEGWCTICKDGRLAIVTNDEEMYYGKE